MCGVCACRGVCRCTCTQGRTCEGQSAWCLLLSLPFFVVVNFYIFCLLSWCGEWVWTRGTAHCVEPSTILCLHGSSSGLRSYSVNNFTHCASMLAPLSSLIAEPGSLGEPGAPPVWLVLLWGSPVPPWDYQGTTTPGSFYVGSGDPTSGLLLQSKDLNLWAVFS